MDNKKTEEVNLVEVESINVNAGLAGNSWSVWN